MGIKGLINKPRLLATLSLLLVLDFWSISSKADICPEPGSIISSNPNQDEEAVYLSPGWRSDTVSIIDLADIRFYAVRIEKNVVNCVYELPNGYLALYPDVPYDYDDEFQQKKHWRCTNVEAQSFSSSTEKFCECRTSLEQCTFDFTADESSVF